MTRIFVFIFLFLLPSLIWAQRSIPEHNGQWVHDEAHVLSPGTIVDIERILKAERDSTTNQIAILIIPSTDGEILEEYSMKVAEKWKIGRKDRDNGVLWLISIGDRTSRIEVGEGLEGVLTDVMASRINRNEVIPHFRQGDYDGGVKAGLMAIIKTIKGEYVNTDPPQRKRSRSPYTTLIVIILIVIFAMSRRGGGGGGGGLWILGSLLGSGMGRSSGSWNSGGGSDYGGGGSFGGGGSSDSW